MKLQFGQKLTLILLFVFLALVTVGFSFYQSTVSTRETEIWESRTQDSLAALDRIVTTTRDAAAAVDSFILTGNDTYLQAYTNARPSIERDLARLRSADNPSDVTKGELGRLADFNNRIFDRLAFKIALRKSTNYETALPELSKADDRALIAGMRESAERAKADETARLDAARRENDRQRGRTIALLILGSIAGIASLAFANFAVFRETARRSAAEQALLEANRDLEKRIDERTSELVAANAELQAAGEERGLILAKEQTARREAEIANRLRDEFMATVSHELRTPLNAVLGWARLLRESSLSQEQSVKAVETIINNAENQNRLIEDLLDVARVISGKLEIDKSDFDLVDTIEAAIDTMQPAAAEKQIEIKFESPARDRAVVVNGDKTRIEQVILNLLTNAVKFSFSGGTVFIRLTADADTAVIGILDEGIGIKPEFLPAVFERFRQDASAAANSGGLGLGLAIVRNLVEIHGGSVSVKSDGENRGAEFTVRLPLKEAVRAETLTATS